MRIIFYDSKPAVIDSGRRWSEAAAVSGHIHDAGASDVYAYTDCMHNSHTDGRAASSAVCTYTHTHTNVNTHMRYYTPKPHTLTEPGFKTFRGCNSDIIEGDRKYLKMCVEL